MATKTLSLKSLSCGFSYARILAIKRNIKKLSTETSCKPDLLSNVSFITNDCTIEELQMVQDLVVGNLEVHENFVNLEEENRLLKEIEPYLSRQSYQYDHWDGAIHGYRETEKARWTKENLRIFKRMKEAAFFPDTKLLSNVHVLDLVKNGFIKPHIDSVKFCGPTIAGVSLLSSSVMRLIHEQYNSVIIDALLPRWSMYVLRGPVRYAFTHEILAEEASRWKGQDITRDRRVSVILRCQS